MILMLTIKFIKEKASWPNFTNCICFYSSIYVPSRVYLGLAWLFVIPIAHAAWTAIIVREEKQEPLEISYSTKQKKYIPYRSD